MGRNTPVVRDEALLEAPRVREYADGDVLIYFGVHEGDEGPAILLEPHQLRALVEVARENHPFYVTDSDSPQIVDKQTIGENGLGDVATVTLLDNGQVWIEDRDGSEGVTFNYREFISLVAWIENEVENDGVCLDCGTNQPLPRQRDDEQCIVCGSDELRSIEHLDGWEADDA